MTTRQRTRWQLALFVLLLVLDQASKWWVERQAPWLHIEVIPGFFDMVQAHNFGVAFSILADWTSQWRTTLLLGVTIGIAGMVSVWWWRERTSSSLESWLLIVILAGAAGNIWDRLQLGYVVDFIDWYIAWGDWEYHWPAFNIADACISVAVVLLLVRSFRKH